MRRIFLFIFSLMMTTTEAQQLFSLEDLNYGGTNYRNMVPQNLFTAWWGDRLVKTDLEECALTGTPDGQDSVIVRLDDINAAVGKLSDKACIRSMYYARFPYAGQPLVLVADTVMRLLYDFDKGEIVWHQAADKETAADFHAASRHTAFVRDDQLYVRTAEGTRQLTTDGSRDIVYGQSVHRDEFGITKGTFWSPDGNRLAFYRMDQSMVTDYPQVNIDERIAACEPDKYPMAGETSHLVTVGVYDTRTGKTVYLDAGDPTDRYFTNIAWNPEGDRIYMQELNRDQNDCRLTCYDAQSGKKLQELYRETDDKYVEPLHPILFLPWNSRQFILQSQKDGYNHLYLFDTDGKEIRQLTSGKWVVMEVLGFNTETRSVIIASNEVSPIQRNLFSVDISTGARKALDNGRGWHDGRLSDGAARLIDRYSEPDVPRNIETVNTATAERHLILSSADPWAGYVQPQFECGTVKAADGVTDLYYRMVKPADFDKRKKYPTVVYVYGGPHAHNVDARWHYASRSWETYMAQKGYIVFILDNRGSENRGKAFEQVTFRRLGQQEMLDQMKGVDFLKSLPYVDQERLGVHGWSYGGYMTISLMTHYPDVFKVGVAGGPVIDWKWYEVMYGERYMDTPQSNPDGYEETSLLAQAPNLKGRLQIITGYNDRTVVPQHCLSFIAACIQAGTQPDFFVYPGEPHNMRGHQSVHLHERITQYFEDYLKQGSSTK